MLAGVADHFWKVDELLALLPNLSTLSGVGAQLNSLWFATRFSELSEATDFA